MDMQFTKVSNESQILSIGLDKFAKSFGHEVTRLFPIWVCHINGKLVSYCYLHSQMVSYPAISPDISPRDFYRLTWTWNSKIKSEFGDPLIVLPKGWDHNILSKVGVIPFDKDVYLIRD